MSPMFGIRLKECKNKCNLLLEKDQMFFYSLSKFEIVNLEQFTEFVIFFVFLRFVKRDLIYVGIHVVKSLEIFKCTEGKVIRMHKSF